jgi:hypothetical protein
MAIEKKVDGLVATGDTAFKPSLEHAVKVWGELSYSIWFPIWIYLGLHIRIKY